MEIQFKKTKIKKDFEMNIFRELLDFEKSSMIFFELSQMEFWTALNCSDVIPGTAQALTIFEDSYYGDDEVGYQKKVEYGIRFTKYVLEELKDELDDFYKNKYNMDNYHIIDNNIKNLKTQFDRINKLNRING